MTLPARARNVVLVRHVATVLAEQLDLSPSLVADVRLAVTEACTNVVRHAYEHDDGELAVTLSTVQPRRLRVVISDRGCGLRRDEPSDGPGLGLALIASLVDELEIDERADRGTTVRMSFGRDG